MPTKLNNYKNLIKEIYNRNKKNEKRLSTREQKPKKISRLT